MRLRLLIAAADTLLLSVYQAFLVDEAIEMRTATTAADCLDQVRSWTPDVLVLDEDLLWPCGKSGLDRLREDPGLPPVPVLLLASPPGIPGEEAMPIRDCALLLKPVRPMVLAGVIRILADSAWTDAPRPTFNAEDTNLTRISLER
jgi:DNA-binding response OmpR family regulator